MTGEGYRYQAETEVLVCDYCHQPIRFGDSMWSFIGMGPKAVRDYHVACLEQGRAEERAALDPEVADYLDGHPTVLDSDGPDDRIGSVFDTLKQVERERDELRSQKACATAAIDNLLRQLDQAKRVSRVYQQLLKIERDRGR